MTPNNETPPMPKLEAALSRMKRGYAQFDTFGTTYAVLYSPHNENDLNLIEDAARSYLATPQPAITDAEILQSALFHGFVLSTAYGQDAGKMMPITDSATLIKFAREIMRFGTPQPARLTDDEVEALKRETSAYLELYHGDVARVIDHLRERGII